MTARLLLQTDGLGRFIPLISDNVVSGLLDGRFVGLPGLPQQWLELSRLASLIYNPVTVPLTRASEIPSTAN